MVSFQRGGGVEKKANNAYKGNIGGMRRWTMQNYHWKER